MMGTESKFRRYFRHLLKENGVWTAAVEHRSGGTAGVTDLLVQCGWLLLPVELKVAKPDIAADILHSSRIRPAQIRLLDECVLAGVRARLLLGLPADPWWVFMLRDVSRPRLVSWRKGFARSELELVARDNELLLPVDQW